MKSNENLWRISVTTTVEAEDAVAELLGVTTGRPASSHCNVETQVCVVSVFGPRNLLLARGIRARVSAGLARIQHCGLQTGPGKITTARVRREDWAESWKRHFKPIEIGDALLIKPSWIKRRPRKNQAVVILDPGLSFGTGRRATTFFCLREVVRCRKPQTPQSFLDIGTGSGILAIAAGKLGYQPVRAVDFDPAAVRVALANARLNQVGNQLSITQDDATKLGLRPATKYDLVCANLISNLLIAERRRLVAQLSRGGTLVLAGILKSEFTQVQTAFQELGWELVAGQSQNEWRSGSFRLKPD